MCLLKHQHDLNSTCAAVTKIKRTYALIFMVICHSELVHFTCNFESPCPMVQQFICKMHLDTDISLYGLMYFNNDSLVVFVAPGVFLMVHFSVPQLLVIFKTLKHLIVIIFNQSIAWAKWPAGRAFGLRPRGPSFDSPCGQIFLFFLAHFYDGFK